VTGSSPVVHLYCADQRALHEEAVARLVTAEDRARLTPAMVERRRVEHLAGRALLRHAIAHRTGRDASSLVLTVTAAGKPECTGGPHVSVSHSGSLVVCAVADVAVGVDVETRPPRDVEAVAERYFTAAEARWIAADPPARFAMLWVLKEAYLKAQGVGLAGGLDSLECRIEPPVIVGRPAHGAAAPQLALLGAEGAFVGVATLAERGPLAVLRHAVAGEAPAAAHAAPTLIAATQ
jgi:phosphopantetheinyl transferase